MADSSQESPEVTPAPNTDATGENIPDQSDKGCKIRKESKRIDRKSIKAKGLGKTWRSTKRTGKDANQRAFLAAYGRLGATTAACERIGLTRQAVTLWMQAEPAFVARMEAAKAEYVERIEREALRRAVDGVTRPVLYHGEPVMIPDPEQTDKPMSKRRKVPLIEHEYSDGLMSQILKAKLPDEYGDRLAITSTTVNISLAGTIPQWFQAARGATTTAGPALSEEHEVLALPELVIQAEQ